MISTHRPTMTSTRSGGKSTSMTEMHLVRILRRRFLPAAPNEGRGKTQCALRRVSAPARPPQRLLTLSSHHVCSHSKALKCLRNDILVSSAGRRWLAVKCGASRHDCSCSGMLCRVSNSRAWAIVWLTVRSLSLMHTSCFGAPSGHLGLHVTRLPDLTGKGVHRRGVGRV